MKKTLFLTALLALALTACGKGDKKPEGSSAQGSKAIQLDPKAAAPVATDTRTTPVDPKTGQPIASEPAKK